MKHVCPSASIEPSLCRFLFLIFCLSLVVIFAPASAAATDIAVVSAASYKPLLSPNSLASLFGTGLSPRTKSAALDANGNLPTSLDGVEVVVGDQPLPLIYISPAQINFVLAGSFQPGSLTVTVRNNGNIVGSGTVNLAACAPGIFIIGNNRAAVLHATSARLEPFEVIDPQMKDGRTRLAIYATGLNAPAGCSAADVQVRAQLSSGVPISLPVEYAGPQRQFVGLDQINVVLPPDLDAVGEVLLSIKVGPVESNALPTLIRAAKPPEVSRLSTDSAPPMAEVSVFGSYFAPVSSRNRIALEQSGNIISSTVPHFASASELRFYVPSQTPPGTTAFSLCVYTDGRRSCISQSFVVSASPAPSAPVGQLLHDYITQTQRLLVQPAQPGEDTAVAEGFNDAIRSRLAGFKTSVDAALRGQPATVSAVGLNGLQELPLTHDSILAFEAMLASGRQLTILNEAIKTMEASSGRFIMPLASKDQRHDASGLSEQDLMQFAQTYLAGSSVYDALDRLSKNLYFNSLMCASHVTPLAIVDELFEKFKTLSDIRLMRMELQSRFLNRIDVLPYPRIHLVPSGATRFYVAGYFTRRSASVFGTSAVSSFLTDWVRDKLTQIALAEVGFSKDFLPQSCLNAITPDDLDKAIEKVASGIVESYTSKESGLGRAINTAFDEVISPPQTVILTPRTTDAVSVAKEFTVYFSQPGAPDGAIVAKDLETPQKAPEVHFLPKFGALAEADRASLPGVMIVEVKAPATWLPPVVKITAQVDGESPMAGEQVEFTAPQSRTLKVTLSAERSETSQGSIPEQNYWWYAIRDSYGQGRTITVSLSPGTYRIYCEARNTGGLTGQASIVIKVNEPPRPVVRLIAPESPVALPDDQDVTVYGAAFAPNQTVDVSLNGQTVGTLTGAQIHGVQPTSFVMRVNFRRTPGRYSIRVNDVPRDLHSDWFSFAVAAYDPPSVKIVSIDPLSPSVKRDDQVIKVIGENFKAPLTVTASLPGGGSVSLSGAQTANVTEKSFDLLITLGAEGPWRIKVRNGDGNESNAYSFTVKRAASTVTVNRCATSPGNVIAGQSFAFTIEGDGFDAQTAEVLFTGPGCSPCEVRNADLRSKNATALAAQTVLNAAGDYTVSVWNGSAGVTSNGVGLSVSSPSLTPKIDYVNPASVVLNQATSISVYGSGFQDGFSAQVSTPDGVLDISDRGYVSPTQLRVGALMRGSAAYDATLKITNPGGASATAALRVNSSTTPGFTTSVNAFTCRIAQGEAASFTLTVTSVNGFSAPVDLDVVGLPGGHVAGGTGWSPQRVSPAANGKVSSTFTIQTNNTTATGTFLLTLRATSSGYATREIPVTLDVAAAAVAAPHIDSMSPNPVPGAATDQPVFLNGTGFQNGSNLKVHVTSGNFSTDLAGEQVTWLSSTQIKILISAGMAAATWTAQVINPNGQSSNVFTFWVTAAAAPQITSISPNSVTVNQQKWLDVYGSGFQSGFTAKVVTSGGTYPIASAGLVFVDSGHVQVQVTMGGATPYTATLTITNPDSQSGSGTFQVVAPPANPPSITSISPSQVTVNTATWLDVYGNYFQSGFSAKVVTSGGTYPIASSGLTFISSTHVQVQVTMGGATPYTATLTITNPDGRASNSYGFTVQGLPAPQISSISPSSPTHSGSNQTVTVYGNYFQSGLTVYISWGTGSTTLSGTQIQNVTSTSFQMIVTLGGAGGWSIRVNNPDGKQSSTYSFTVR